MNRIDSISFAGLQLILLAFAGLAGCGESTDTTDGSAQTGGTDSAAQTEGLWEYTNLITSDGKEMPLTGVFLLKDGTFVQQAVFDGTPFDEQSAMAHAGPYTTADGSVHLIAEQTISTAPGGEEPLNFRADTEHDVSVTRDGNSLTMVFGSGTIQEFERIGEGSGELYGLENGALAFVDGYFVLVRGDEQSVVTGYGTYEKDGNDLELKVIRWAEADRSEAVNRRNVNMAATFDGRSLELEDGRSFRVAR